MSDWKPENILSGNPRVRGIHEHLDRARYFYNLSTRESDPQPKYRLLLSSLYSCRAIAEIMLESAEKGEIGRLNSPDQKSNRTALEVQIAPMIPYYALIERIRIHDFHRFGIVAPNPAVAELMYGGPIKLTAERGAAIVGASASGPQVQTTGRSSVKSQRPLLIRDGEFFDEESTRFVGLEELLMAFLTAAPQVVSEFEQLIAP